MANTRKIEIYTDGSCYSKHPKKLGGFGIYLKYIVSGSLEAEKEFNKGYSGTTSARMELRAIIKALQMIKNKKVPVYIISDSEYIVEGINEGAIFGWEEDVTKQANPDLLKEFFNEIYKFNPLSLHFIHTRGHGKGKEEYREGNSRADKLASYKNFTEYEQDTTIE